MLSKENAKRMFKLVQVWLHDAAENLNEWQSSTAPNEKASRLHLYSSLLSSKFSKAWHFLFRLNQFEIFTFELSTVLKLMRKQPKLCTKIYRCFMSRCMTDFLCKNYTMDSFFTLAGLMQLCRDPGLGETDLVRGLRGDTSPRRCLSLRTSSNRRSCSIW